MKQETLNQINAPSQAQLDALVDDANDISNHECKCQLSTLLQQRVHELEAEVRVYHALIERVNPVLKAILDASEGIPAIKELLV